MECSYLKQGRGYAPLTMSKQSKEYKLFKLGSVNINLPT